VTITDEAWLASIAIGYTVDLSSPISIAKVVQGLPVVGTPIVTLQNTSASPCTAPESLLAVNVGNYLLTNGELRLYCAKLTVSNLASLGAVVLGDNSVFKSTGLSGFAGMSIQTSSGGQTLTKL